MRITAPALEAKRMAEMFPESEILVVDHERMEIPAIHFASNRKRVDAQQWPIWAKAFKFMAKPEDKGIGDVVARMIGAENSEAFKTWHLKVFGKSCGCKGRQVRWNLLYPL